MKPKEITFRLPYTVWEEFTKAFPRQGEKSDFLRRAVGVGIKFRKREEVVVKELLKVMLREEEREEEKPLN